MTRVAEGSSSLSRRLAGLLIVAAVVLGVLLVTAGVAFGRLVQVQHQVTDDLFDATAATGAHTVSLVDAETGLRGYALTGDPVTLQPYDDARADTTTFAAIASGLDHITDDPALTTAARAADTAAQDWFADYAEPLVEQIGADGPRSVTAAQIEQGKERFDVVRARADAFSADLGQVRAHEAHSLDRWTRIAGGVVALLALAGVAAGIVVWIALRRWVLRPLDALSADSRAVASGALDHGVTATGPGEIASLADDVEAMRRTLVGQVQAADRARAALERANERLTDQAEELHRSNRDLEQFAYVASHDLQEPLRKVASFTQLLQKRYGGSLDERADQYIDFAVDGAKRMQRLIQDLLGFSRVGRVGGEVVDVPLDVALASALENLEQLVEESGAVVTAHDLPVVRGEQPLLVQLLQNLVGNAIKFRSPDRVPDVRVSARRTAEGWQLECRDNGIGIDPQYADRVFVIFQRLHPKDVYEGTGIGLALSKKIVEFHGGRIWIEQPDDGVGTVIRWTLGPGGR
jgi:signal transduction histidine kinase